MHRCRTELKEFRDDEMLRVLNHVTPRRLTYRIPAGQLTDPTDQSPERIGTKPCPCLGDGGADACGPIPHDTIDATLVEQYREERPVRD